MLGASTIAQGREFEERTDEESVANSDDEEIRVSGAIKNQGADIMAEAKRRKRTHITPRS